MSWPRPPGGPTEEELRRLERSQSLPHAIERQALLTDDQRVERGRVWNRISDPGGNDLWLIVDPVASQTAGQAIARFCGYVSIRDAKTSFVEEWLVHGYLGRNSAGELVVLRETVEPRIASETGVTTDVMRAASAAKIVAKAPAILLAEDEWQELLEAWGWRVRLGNRRRTRTLAQTAAETGARRGRPALTEGHYQLVAETALELQHRADGNARGVYEQLARMFRRDPATISDWVGEARRRRILAPTSRGKIGFAPGENYSGRLPRTAAR